MRAIDADKLLSERMKSKYYHLPNGDIAIPIIDIENAPTIEPAQPEEVIPHRNYKYLSDYWCECGWHLGKKGEVKYCSECGRKVNWDG